MKYEDAREWSEKITGYFGKGYSNEQLIDITNFMKNMTADDAAKIYNKLKELNRVTYKIDLHALYEATNSLGIRPAVDTRETNALMAGKRIPCSMCGHEFIFNRYAPCTDSFGGPVSSCPVCGWNELQSLYWREAGSPAPEASGYGANYVKWFAAYETNLAEHKRTTLSSRLADEKERRRDEKPLAWTEKPRQVAEKIYS